MSDVTLAGWLLEQIAADEDLARAAAPGPWTYGSIESVAGGSLYDPGVMIAGIHWDNPGDHDGRIHRFRSEEQADRTGEHIVRHDPARVLAECEAKRRIVDAYLDERSRRDIYQRDDARAVEDDEQATRRRSSAARCRGLEIAVELLALPYADRPGYDESWRP